MAPNAMAPEKTKSLHNFSLPPRLRWGSQKLLRCSKLNDDDDSDDHDSVPVPASDRKRRPQPPPPSQNSPFVPNPATTFPRQLTPAESQIESIREKLIIDLRCEVDQMRASLINTHIAPQPPTPPPPPPPASAPWNLRARRAACKEPLKAGSGKTAAEKAASPATRRGTVAGDSGRAKFSVTLTKQEIEDDFVKMLGKRPPRKPKKRPRLVQRQLETVFVGMWLSEITADMYKVNENPESAGK